MTTVSTDALREELVRHLDAGQADEFLTLATPYLVSRCDDHYVRLMAVREYLKLGLIPPARELLDVDTSRVDLPPEFDPVKASLATLTGAAIPWSRYADQFESNLAALTRRGVGVEVIREAWANEQQDYELLRDALGRDQVRQRDQAGRWRWAPRIGDHRALAEAYPLPEGSESTMPGPFLFDGLDLGRLFERIYAMTTDTFLGYSCALYVVEPDAAALALVLHLHDWHVPLSDPRVFWFVGDNATQQMLRLWQGNADLPWPRHAFRLNALRRCESPQAVEAVETAGQAREIEIRQSLNDLDQRYASRDRTYWAKRFTDALSGRGDPLRILAAVSTHTTFLQYSMRDAIGAFEALGHRCVLLTEKTCCDVISPSTYHRAIRDLDPDLFFNIDHLRPEFAGVIPDNLPLLTWDQDQLPHVFTKANIEKIGPLDFVAGCSKSQCLLFGADPAQFLQAQIPTCPERFGGDPLSDDERHRYDCDISYVSHASQTAKAFHEETKASQKDESIRRFLDVMYELVPHKLAEHGVMDGALALTIIEEAAGRLGLAVGGEELRGWLRGWYLWRLADRLFRHEALEWVASWARRTGRSFRIYGNGWKDHPTLRSFAAGPAQNGRELLCIYRASKINLQLMPAGFIHQRALDGLAGGGFFLCRKTPYDVRGRALRRLDARIRSLGIDSTVLLAASKDEELGNLLAEYLGRWRDRIDKSSDNVLNNIRIAAERLHPDEIFPDFEDILFDSPGEFAAVVERFLSDDARRTAVAQRMRDVVLDRLTYRPTMDRFLKSMARYLSGA